MRMPLPLRAILPPLAPINYRSVLQLNNEYGIGGIKNPLLEKIRKTPLPFFPGGVVYLCSGHRLCHVNRRSLVRIPVRVYVVGILQCYYFHVLLMSDM
jgi:hypothetical protein